MSTTYIKGDNIVFTSNSGNDITIKAENGKKLIFENVQVTKTDVIQATNFVGQIVGFPNIEFSGGFLPCVGQACSKADYPLLHAKLGGQFGETTETFSLPDYSGSGAAFNYSMFAGFPVSGIAPLTEVNYSFTGAGTTLGNRFFGLTRTFVSGSETLITFLSNDSFRLPSSTVGRTFYLDLEYTGTAQVTSTPLVKTGMGINVTNIEGGPEGSSTTTFSVSYIFVQTAADAVFEFRTPNPPDSYFPIIPLNSTGTIKLSID